jgi:type I restriction enzyme S subunit
MAKGKKKEVLTLEERLQAALVPESEQPYQVPGNWCWTRIEYINQYNSCSMDPAKQSDEMFELYSVPSSAGNYPEILSGDEIGSIKQSVQKGDVLLCKINPRINRVWQVSKYTNNTLLASSEWIVVRNKYLNSEYLMRCFQSNYFREFMLSNVSGVGGSLMRAQPKYVQGYPVPIPPLSEQQRIVECIESLFAKLDEARQKVQDVLDGFEPRRAAILHKAFSGELTAQWRKEHGVGMEEWIDTVLSKVVTGFKYGTSEKSDYSYAGMPVFRIPNITENGLSFEDMKFLPHYDVKEESQIHENDILIIRSNGSRDLVGKSVLVPKLDVSYAYASFLIKIKPSAAIVPDFLVLYLNSTGARVQMFKKAKSSVGINNINAKELGGIALKIPSIQEQSKVVHVLDDLFAKERQVKEASETVLEQIDLIKKSILARAFRGELGTNDPAEESALELIKQTLSETIANNGK